MRFREEVTIVFPGGEEVQSKASMYAVTSTEDKGEGNIPVTDWMLFLPAGTEITGKCRVRGREEEFEVVGKPDEKRSLLTTNSPHHIEALLKIIGSSESEADDFTDEESF